MPGEYIMTSQGHAIVESTDLPRSELTAIMYKKKSRYTNKTVLHLIVCSMFWLYMNIDKNYGHPQEFFLKSIQL